ncbi:hypothetical protein IW148_002387 [Coemansia sp. RSA 1199]|nr:hypothetical protein IW148_002387 [Coemansia sp. RSA 1199]
MDTEHHMHNSEDERSSANSSVTGEALGNAGSATPAAGIWREDLTNLLTPQTVTEQAQTTRRRRNREAARRSRQRLKDREHELVERQEKLKQRLKFLEQELTEWRLLNLSSGVADAPLVDPKDLSDSDDGAVAANLNRIYSLTTGTLSIITQLQLQLDEITRELTSMISIE